MRAKCILAAIALLGMCHSAFAAPASNFYGKTLRINWNESRSQRDMGESTFKPVSLPFTLTVYVSTKGQVFRRLNAVGRTGREHGSQDRVGAGANAEGASQISFQGNTFLVTTSSGGLGRRIRVTFDGGSSCSAEVLAGKSGRGVSAVRSVATGNMVEFESVSAGAATCSAQDGNAFAN